MSPGSNGTELATERLQLRMFRPEDFAVHAEICADPKVMRYIRAGPIPPEEAWWQIARYLGHWRLRGYGMWAVVEKATDELIGHIGFLNPEGGHGFELGWALARHAWGRGYALEGTRAAVRHAFTALDRDHILCLIRPENARSIRLAERLGGCSSARSRSPDSDSRYTESGDREPVRQSRAMEADMSDPARSGRLVARRSTS
jgi:RimJ/RimL family protein N-acetyltransferase